MTMVERSFLGLVEQKQQVKHAILLSDSIYWKTQIVQRNYNGTYFYLHEKPLLCRQKEFVLTLGLHW